MSFKYIIEERGQNPMTFLILPSTAEQAFCSMLELPSDRIHFGSLLVVMER